MPRTKNPNATPGYSSRQKEQMAPSAYLLNKARAPREIANLERLQAARPLKPPAKRRSYW